MHAVKDIRIFYKECKSLSKAGYEVFYIVSHDRAELLDDIHVIPLPFPSSRLKRIIVHPLLALKESLKLKALIYHIHDPELLPIGWILRIVGKKVIYDAHEHLAKDILDKPWIQSRAARKIVSFGASFFEHLSVRVLSGVVGATSHIAAQFIPQKTALVRNFPMLGFIAEVPRPSARQDGKYTIVYTGGLTRIRGIVQMVAAMNHLPVDTELVLAGQWEDNAIENECMMNPGWSKCRYVGQIPQRDAYALMKGADLGILTFLPAANHFEAMPNKAFEYLACGLPMVISDFPYWKQLFGSNAQYVDPSDPVSIAQGIEQMLVKIRKEKKSSGNEKASVSVAFSWEAEEKVLLDFYRKLLQQH